MGKRFKEIPADTFNALQTDAGVLLADFDIDAAAADDSEPGYTNDDIICATTGGVQVSAKPTFSDMGEDVDNVPLNMKELKHLDSWEVNMSTTMVSFRGKTIGESLGCADVSADGHTIIPRSTLKQKDFHDLWWVGPKTNGGFLAVKLLNALSTDGLSLQSGKNAKNQSAITYSGHVSLNAQDVVPIVCYDYDPNTLETYTVTFANSDVPSQQISSGGKVTKPTDPTKAGYTFGGWYADSTFQAAWDFDNNMILADTTIYAKWTAATVTHSVTQTLTHVTSSYTGTTVNDGAEFTATLTAEDTYTLGDVTVTMGGTDITSTAYDDGVVLIDSVSGDIVITATAA